VERGERKDEEVVQVRKAERGRKEEERKGEDVEQSIEYELVIAGYYMSRI